MTQAKQEQPFFTALVDRRMAPDIAPAVRLFCREECTEDSTSACSEEKKRVSEGASGAANGGLAGLRCTCDIANSMLMKASTRDIITPRLVSAPDRARRGQHRDFSSSPVNFTRLASEFSQKRQARA